MPRPTTDSKNILRMIMMGLPLIALTACSNNFGPFSVPSGYTYHADKYKAPPGPELVRGGFVTPKHEEQEEEFTAPELEETPEVAIEENIEIQETLVDPVLLSLDPDKVLLAANKILDRIEVKFGKLTEPLYLKAADPDESLNPDFEKALRQAMNSRGYDLAPVPGHSPFHMIYGITHPAAYHYDSQATLSLTLMGGKTELAFDSGKYVIVSPSKTDRGGYHIAEDHPDHLENPRQTMDAQQETGTGKPVSLFPE